MKRTVYNQTPADTLRKFTITDRPATLDIPTTIHALLAERETYINILETAIFDITRVISDTRFDTEETRDQISSYIADALGDRWVIARKLEENVDLSECERDTILAWLAPDTTTDK